MVEKEFIEITKKWGEKRSKSSPFKKIIKGEGNV